MTTPKTTDQRLNTVERKVDSLAQRQDEVVIPGIDDIKRKMENFAYVSSKDYAEYQVVVNSRLKLLEEFNEKYEPGIKTANLVNSTFGKAVISALVVGLLALLVWSLSKVTPSIGG